MKKVPTVEQYLHDNYHPYYDEDNCPVYQEWQVKQAIIEFAKLHVEQALANRDMHYQTYYAEEINWTEDNKKFITDSYPLTNIK